MGLFDKFKKNKPVKTNSYNEPLDKLIDGELPRGWAYYNQEFIKTREKPLPEYAISAQNANSIDERIRILQEMISYYENIRREFYSKGECFQKYFQDMWENCHISKGEDFDYIDPYKKELKNLLDNHDDLVEKERVRNENLIGLEDKLYLFLKDNSGILQQDVYKQFDASIKADIQELLYFWSKNGKIEREKSGRTYKIIIKE